MKNLPHSHHITAEQRERDSTMEKLLNIMGWIIGVLVALTVGSSLVTADLHLPYLPEIFEIVIGWLILILTIIGVLLALGLGYGDDK